MTAPAATSSSIRLGKDALKTWAAAASSAHTYTILFQAVATLAWVAIAWGIGHAVSDVSHQKPPLIPVSIAFSGLIVRTVCIWLSERSAAAAGMAITAAARRNIFERISVAGSGLLAGTSAGERTSQIIDRTAKLFGYGARWLPGMRLAILSPVIILVAVASQTWLAAALLLVSVLVLPVFIWLTASETAATARAQQASLDNLSGAFQSRAEQAGLIRAFRAVGRETEALEHASEALRTRTMAILKVAFLSTAVLEFFASISIALVAVYIGFKLLGVFPFQTGETITLAEGMTALVLAPEFFAPIRRLSSLHHDRADGAAAAGMLAPWLAAGTSAPPRRLERLSQAPEISFRQVALAFDSNGPHLPPISFTAGPSRITALSGPSGSGKTSCLLALLGRAHVRSGTIFVNDVSLAQGDSLADSVAYLRQTPWVTEGTLAENIALARPGATREAILDAARQAGVLAFATPERGGLDQKLARFGVGLSGGQRQRLALARAILRDAPLLLLDEPTAHLDEDAERDFLDLLRNLATGRTILIATHSDTVRAACDQTVDLTAAAVQVDPS